MQGMRDSLMVLLAAALGLCLPAPSNAAEGWTSYGTVQEIYPNSTGAFYVRINVSSNPASTCLASGFSHPGTGNGANRVFAALLSAHASGKPVRVYVLGTCDQWAYAEITAASLAS